MRQDEYTQRDLLSAIRASLSYSSKGQALLDEAEHWKVEITLEPHPTGGLRFGEKPGPPFRYDSKRNLVRLDGSRSVDELVLHLAHELQHAEDRNVHKTLFPDADLAIEHHIEWKHYHERRAHAASCLVALELKEQGRERSYQEALRSEHLRDIVEEMESYLRAHPGAFGDAFKVGQDQYFRGPRHAHRGETREDIYVKQASNEWIASYASLRDYERPHGRAPRVLMPEWWRARDQGQAPTNADFSLVLQAMYPCVDREEDVMLSCPVKLFTSATRTPVAVVARLPAGAGPPWRTMDVLTPNLFAELRGADPRASARGMFLVQHFSCDGRFIIGKLGLDPHGPGLRRERLKYITREDLEMVLPPAMLDSALKPYSGPRR